MKYRVIDSTVDDIGNIHLQVYRWFGWVTIKWWYFESYTEYYKLMKLANKIKLELEKK